MKNAISNIILLAIVAFLAYTFYSSGSGIYASYKNREEKRKTLARFYSRLSSLGWQRLQAEQIQPTTQEFLDRYYVLRSRTLPTLTLKATTAYSFKVNAVPTCFMVVYEKVDVFGAKIASGRKGPSSEYQATLVAASMPLPAGRTMIYRRPASEDDGPWDWFGEKPLLGAQAHRIEKGLKADFLREFSVRSTNKTASVPGPVQELLLQNTQLFVDSDSTRSALVIDESGWGYVSTVITDEALLDRLITFQDGLIQRLSPSVGPRN